MLLNKRCMDKSEQMDYAATGDYSTMNMGMGANPCCENQFPGVTCPPIYECPQVRCCHREIFHEVPQV